jgi:hypothetical protein
MCYMTFDLCEIHTEALFNILMASFILYLDDITGDQ